MDNFIRPQLPSYQKSPRLPWLAASRQLVLMSTGQSIISLLQSYRAAKYSGHLIHIAPFQWYIDRLTLIHPRLIYRAYVANAKVALFVAAQVLPRAPRPLLIPRRDLLSSAR